MLLLMLMIMFLIMCIVYDDAVVDVDLLLYIISHERLFGELWSHDVVVVLRMLMLELVLLLLMMLLLIMFYLLEDIS